MELLDRIGRSGRVAALLAVGALGGAAALAVASVPDSSGVIHGCYAVSGTNGTTVPATTAANLTIIDPGAGQTCPSAVGAPATEQSISWNVAGPQGPTGPAGAAGAAGQNGAPGPTSTIASGHTFTISGGQVITVGGAPGITIASPPISPRGTVGQVVMGTGKSALTFNIVGLGLVNPGRTSQTGSGGGAGKASVNDISVIKTVDSSSPKLSLACASGKHFSNATIFLRKAGKVYLRYSLTDAMISSYQTGGHGNGTSGVPVESLSLNFTKLQIQYSK